MTQSNTPVNFTHITNSEQLTVSPDVIGLHHDIGAISDKIQKTAEEIYVKHREYHDLIALLQTKCAVLNYAYQNVNRFLTVNTDRGDFPQGQQVSPEPPELLRLLPKIPPIPEKPISSIFPPEVQSDTESDKRIAHNDRVSQNQNSHNILDITPFLNGNKIDLERLLFHVMGYEPYIARQIESRIYDTFDKEQLNQHWKGLRSPCMIIESCLEKLKKTGKVVKINEPHKPRCYRFLRPEEIVSNPSNDPVDPVFDTAHDISNDIGNNTGNDDTVSEAVIDDHSEEYQDIAPFLKSDKMQPEKLLSHVMGHGKCSNREIEQRLYDVFGEKVITKYWPHPFENISNCVSALTKKGKVIKSKNDYGKFVYQFPKSDPDTDIDDSVTEPTINNVLPDSGNDTDDNSNDNKEYDPIAPFLFPKESLNFGRVDGSKILYSVIAEEETTRRQLVQKLYDKFGEDTIRSHWQYPDRSMQKVLAAEREKGKVIQRLIDKFSFVYRLATEEEIDNSRKTEPDTKTDIVSNDVSDSKDVKNSEPESIVPFLLSMKHSDYKMIDNKKIIYSVLGVGEITGQEILQKLYNKFGEEVIKSYWLAPRAALGMTLQQEAKKGNISQRRVDHQTFAYRKSSRKTPPFTAGMDSEKDLRHSIS